MTAYQQRQEYRINANLVSLGLINANTQAIYNKRIDRLREQYLAKRN